MNTALQTAQTAPLDLAAGVFLPLVKAAMQDQAYDTWLRTFRGRPELITPPGVLALALATGQVTTDADICEAIDTELTIAYRCDITALQPVQAAYPMLAVVFKGNIILPTHIYPADPVDLIALGAMTSDQHVALAALRTAVGRLLIAEAQHDRTGLASATEQFQRLQQSAKVFPGRAALLYGKVLAANIKLCIRAVS